MTRTRTLDELGCAELAPDDPLVADALGMGWELYEESEDSCWKGCSPLPGHDPFPAEAGFVGFTLSKSKLDPEPLVVVYDPRRWKIDRQVFDEDDTWMFPERLERLFEAFYGRSFRNG